MAAKMCVTRITVDYVVDGKLFSVNFPPREIASIFFSAPNSGRGKEDMDKAKPGNAREAAFRPGLRLQDQEGIKGLLAGITSQEINTGLGNPSGPVMWWHTGECNWFHPE